jgi:thiamine-phosphate pyrophosphorylase
MKPTLSTIETLPMTPKKRQRLDLFDTVDLYPVTCEELSNGRTDLQVLDAVAKAGCKIIQLRDKRSSRRIILEKAKVFRERTLEYGMLLIINDHVDIALAVDADGVHLGQDDFPVKDARTLIPDMIIGTSCHDPGEPAQALADGADYFNIGPIYPTGTKENAPKFLGLGAISTLGAECDLPFTVMGGIKADHIPGLTAAGARKIALVTAITQMDDMVAAAKGLRTLIQG